MPRKLCQHDGCTVTDVEEWSIAGYDPEPVFVFCYKHAAEFGFCTSCGAFIGGTEDCFLTGRAGICFKCFTFEEEHERREMEYQFGDDDYDE